ncbi:DNA-binding GntR family transcriptional regulator [Hydrogenoanaerobacterium saccharovorans]|uniref:DNA-binding transcriptional regulator, GntR family n=1 Tax=Hydrogenoanaerobacterium saccharovorans TaxID=474960 RepID=A0A1H8B773_9FIRM|nr:GntR family transcriptional regulator [Hydrogenoanaerobacterium saccharovorans]RPF47558.1 DNA-binding GntR family transcriptional regulator [Hydrogenoanaerobacterium saccharovorans]SEM78576.1 DNA-binding transcriptional regulator, GntR family [Hydrogenoanaerobacterium saccharovorans]
MANESSLKSKIYAAVFDSIIKGEYGPNDVLSEKGLVEKFNVSKSPVREALIELCNEGVLRSIPRYGYEVIRLTDRDVQDIQRFRLILECGCLEQYWDMITPEHIEHLEQMLAEDYQGSLEHDALIHWAKNTKFHLALISCFHNEYIYRSLKASLTTLSRAYAQFYWDKWHKTEFVSFAGGHKQFLEHLKNNDKEAAVRTLQKDISGFEDLDAK